LRRMELLFIVLFAYLKNIKKDKLRKAVDAAAEKDGNLETETYLSLVIMSRPWTKRPFRI
jgi:hypothetical protein